MLRPGNNTQVNLSFCIRPVSCSVQVNETDRTVIVTWDDAACLLGLLYVVFGSCISWLFSDLKRNIQKVNKSKARTDIGYIGIFST